MNSGVVFCVCIYKRTSLLRRGSLPAAAIAPAGHESRRYFAAVAAVDAIRGAINAARLSEWARSEPFRAVMFENALEYAKVMVDLVNAMETKVGTKRTVLGIGKSVVDTSNTRVN